MKSKTEKFHFLLQKENRTIPGLKGNSKAKIPKTFWTMPMTLEEKVIIHTFQSRLFWRTSVIWTLTSSILDKIPSSNSAVPSWRAGQPSSPGRPSSWPEAWQEPLPRATAPLYSQLVAFLHTLCTRLGLYRGGQCTSHSLIRALLCLWPLMLETGLLVCEPLGHPAPAIKQRLSFSWRPTEPRT